MVKETKLYDLLGISPSANEQEIKKGYRKAALKYHPDKPTGDTEKFKEISEAFEILSDPQKREVYDQYGLEAARNGGPAFGGAGGFPGGGFSSAGGAHAFSNDDAFNIFRSSSVGARRSVPPTMASATVRSEACLAVWVACTEAWAVECTAAWAAAWVAWVACQAGSGLPLAHSLRKKSSQLTCP